MVPSLKSRVLMSLSNVVKKANCHSSSCLSIEGSSPLLLMIRYFRSEREPPRGFGFDDDDESNTRKGSHGYQNPPEPIPNRPLRGDRPPPFNPRSSQLNSRQPSFRGSTDSPRRPRPASSHLFPDKDDTAQNVAVNGDFRSSRLQFLKQRDNEQSDENFLEKFKLGVDKKENPSTNASTTATATRDKSNIDQAVPEEPPSMPQDADEIFKKMKETGLIPNAVAMLDGLCKDGLVQEAMKLFGLMREKGTIPEVVIYTAVVDGFCKAHNLDEAKRIFRKMQNNGITPNAFSYTVLIQGLYKCKKLDDAIDYCVEMLEAGHSPNVMTFVGLVDGLCKEKGVEEAKSVILTLRQKGFVVNDKAIREFLDKKAPFSSSVWEAIFGKKTTHQKLF